MPKAEISLDEDFASTMQQLVAEAAKAPLSQVHNTSEGMPSDGIRSEFAEINDRIGKLEQAVTSGLETLAGSSPAQGSDVAKRLERVDENLLKLCETESVNHRLFNSLHQELKEYRDNFLRESLQKPFIRDLVVLFDDLTSLAGQMETAGLASGSRQGKTAQWRSNLENAIHSVVEILHRMDVNEIEPKDKVDRVFHRVVSYEPADFLEEDGQIVMRIKRGFLWRNHVLRPEEVVAKRFSDLA
jgi:molecular chaperone GrpE (heat shock protein)